MKSIFTFTILLAACVVGSLANPEEFAGNAYRKTVSRTGGAGGTANANGQAYGNVGNNNGNGGTASANGGNA
ncbi:hypothetical protein CVT26_001482 [Gymnopilus dilepis]|uniref:Uncharacterized protein n=1 Tax=Gymnopilus dilepis TaxID=231916 RepID=A0A409WBE0_9AGAR|nr:hypothetical protein CVT26_001482 [Gymnopilus dilepis]